MSPTSIGFLGVTAKAGIDSTEVSDFSSLESRTRLTKMLMKLFDHWQLSLTDQLALLGLGLSSRASINAYRKGKPLANSQDALDRAGHLLAIHKSLRALLPYDRDLVYGWIKAPNKAFHGKSPLAVMVEYRFAGLLKVRAYLEHARLR